MSATAPPGPQRHQEPLPGPPAPVVDAAALSADLQARTQATVDAALANADWLTPGRFGLADAGALPYVLRMEHLAMDGLIAPRARVSSTYRRRFAGNSVCRSVERPGLPGWSLWPNWIST